MNVQKTTQYCVTWNRGIEEFRSYYNSMSDAIEKARWLEANKTPHNDADDSVITEICVVLVYTVIETSVVEWRK